MLLRRKVSQDVLERYAADTELAATYRDRIAAVAEAERNLRQAQGRGDPQPRLRDLTREFDDALGLALQAAEAAERVAMGPRTYPPQRQGATDRTRRTAQIAARKARARPRVWPWTLEVERLRTARERHRFSFRPEVDAA